MELKTKMKPGPAHTFSVGKTVAEVRMLGIPCGFGSGNLRSTLSHLMTGARASRASAEGLINVRLFLQHSA
jgi:hypothetical protein